MGVGRYFPPCSEQLIAFWSERSGEEQVWISNGSSPQQLTRFPLDTAIHGFDWAADGNSLLVNANNILTQVNLDSSQKIFRPGYPIVRLFQWDSEKGSALLLVRIRGVFKFVEHNLNNAETRVISDEYVLWAQKSEAGRLIYKDLMDQFWQLGPAEAQGIKALEDQSGRSKPFMVKENMIYAINRENHLWSYNLNSEAFEVLGEVRDNVDYLTDINRNRLLMTTRISARKEVVELSMGE